MNLKDILTKPVSELKPKDFAPGAFRRPAEPKDYRIMTAASFSRGDPRANQKDVLLAPFKTLVSYPFSIPFGRKGNVREALLLSFRPILGETEKGLFLVPQVTEQTANLTKGVAWLLSYEEAADWEERFGGDVAFWPAPLAFASEVDGNGVVVWADEEGSAAVWLSEGETKFYRWTPADESTPEELAEWVRSYAQAQGADIKEVCLFREGEITPYQAESCGRASLACVPGLDGLDLSTSGADNAAQIEAYFAAAFHTLRVLTVLGAVFLVLSAAFLFQSLSYRSSFRALPKEAYARAFGEESNSPLTSANRILRNVTGGGGQMSLAQVLSNFTAAWKNSPDSAGIKIDTIRYGAERTEIQGLADTTDAISQLRDELNKQGFTARTGEVQQVPGSGLRFSINLTGASK